MSSHTMRALRYLAPGQIEVQEVPRPVPAEGEVLIHVFACGICGSDVHGYLGLTGRRNPMVILGHEFSGEVVENRVPGSEYEIGAHVIVQPICYCGTCRNCLQGMTNMCLNKRFYGVLSENGAMAEYIAVSEKLLCRMPDDFPPHLGALAEPYAVAYGAVSKLPDLDGRRVLIIGAGTIGLCLLQLIRQKRPRQIVVSDLSRTRLDRALSLGADVCINPGTDDFLESVEACTDGEMIDISVEAVGVQITANQSIQCLKVGGTSIWVGMSQKEMTINMQDIVCHARTVIGSFNYTQQEFEAAARLITGRQLSADRLVSRVITLEECPHYFEAIHQNPDDYIKVLVDPRRI